MLPLPRCNSLGTSVVSEHLEDLEDVHLISASKAELLLEEASFPLLLEYFPSTCSISNHLLVDLFFAIGIIDLLIVVSILTNPLSIDQVALIENLSLTLVTAIEEIPGATHVSESLLEVVSRLLERRLLVVLLFAA